MPAGLQNDIEIIGHLQATRPLFGSGSQGACFVE